MDGRDDDILSLIEEKFKIKTLIYIPAINNVLLQRTFIIYSDKDGNDCVGRVVDKGYEERSKFIKIQRYPYISSK